MGTVTTPMQHVFRQRSSLGLAAVCSITGLLFLLALARNWADYPRPLFVAWVVFGLAVVWSVFARPAVEFDLDGVTLRNVIRDVHIPWARLTDATSQWNLKVWVEAQGHTSWAISSQAERPRGSSGGMFGLPLGGRLDRSASADPRGSGTFPKITAQTVARSIMAAKQEYDVAVAQGQLPTSADDPVRITWVSLNIVVLLLSAAVVVALSVV